MLALCAISAGARRCAVPAAGGAAGAGLYGPNNIALMVRRLGETAAADILMTARILDAVEAHRVGIATSVMPVQTFDAESGTVLARIAAMRR